MNPAERHAAVESLAYDLWIARGRPAGTPDIDWIEAERRFKENGLSTDAHIVRSSLTRSDEVSGGNFSQEIASEAHADALGDSDATVINPSVPQQTQSNSREPKQERSSKLGLPKSQKKRP